MSETTPLLPKLGRNLSKKYLTFIVVPSTILVILLIYVGSILINGSDDNNNFISNLPSFLVKPLQLRIYTNNIRFDNVYYPDKGEKSWTKHRSKQVINSIDFHTSLGDANVVCLQEVLYHQLGDILDGLNDNSIQKSQNWTYYGIGRDDGIIAGEFSPILYKHHDWILLENETFWLSETPWKPSRGWDAALERIVTMVTLQSRFNPLIKINVFNTHFDHKGKLARKRSAQLIVDKMENYNNNPSFLCGDFNTEPSDQPYAVLTKAGFKDSRLVIPQDFSYGEESTFTGFDKDNEVKHSVIDYIWSPYFTVSKDKDDDNDNDFSISNYYSSDHHEYYKIIIKHFGILHNFFKGFYFSDHRPVVATYDISRTRLFGHEME
ncbi:Endonuclease/exonuclease/phosphatase [Scheffersomyces coipomensis]|uniref:Endonuclease/exonuclease/phosphatase n=1 Tax=Scheffersomyces coipomensis TaxID=1788519 RepID=UPI00315D02CA